MAILLNSSKTKISNNSHKISLIKLEKDIEDIVNSNDQNKTKRVSFIEIGHILNELKIFRELFQNSAHVPEAEKKKFITYKKEYNKDKDIKSELIHVKEQDKRRKQEIDFYEQIWLILNPENKDSIKTDIVIEFLKILFSPIASSTKEISLVLKQFLQAAFFLTINPEDIKSYVSPITGGQISEEEVWPLEKLVKEFLILKKNILAYRDTHHYGKRMKDDIDKINVLNI